jgi:hypothetical protein
MACARSGTPSSTRRLATRTSPPNVCTRSPARSTGSCRHRDQTRRSRRLAPVRLAQPALEVADIFRDHGAACHSPNRRRQHVDSAGSLERFELWGVTASRSTENMLIPAVALTRQLMGDAHYLPRPALPQVPGRRGERMDGEREAELLLVPTSTSQEWRTDLVQSCPSYLSGPERARSAVE